MRFRRPFFYKKNKRMKYCLTAFLLAGLCFLGNAQSGWVKEKGELFAQVSASTFASDEYFGVTGERFENINEFQQRSLNLYGEYGLTPRLTGILNTSILRLNGYPTTDVVAAPGDLRLELKYALSKKIPLAISIAPEIPIAPADNFATAKQPNDLGIREQINLATTDGEFNIWTTLAASTPLPKGKGWATAFGAFNLRTKGFSHQFQAGFELGFQPVEPLFFKARLTTQYSLGEPEEGVPFFRGEGTEMAAASIGAGWRFSKNWGVSLDWWRNFDAIVSTKNAYVGQVWSVGVFYQK
jgi:hypothetical protein